MRPDYAVVVLYYRAGRQLRRTIAAVLDQSVRPIQVIVVDNASDDGVAVDVTATIPQTTLITLGTNRGYSGGMNAGIAALADGVRFVLLLTHETVLRADCAEQLLAALDDGAAALVGPVLSLHRDGRIWSAGGGLTRSGRAFHRSAAAAAEPYEVEWLDGAALLADRHALAAAGGFDERYFLYWEDVDVSLRLGRAGRVLCVPGASAGQDTGEAPPYYAARNRILLWRSHRAPARVVASVVDETGRAIMSLLRRRRGRDAGGRMLGVLHGITGGLDPAHGRLRSGS